MEFLVLIIIYAVSVLSVFFCLWAGVEIAIWDKGRSWVTGIIFGLFNFPGLLVLFFLVPTDWTQKKATWAEYSARRGFRNPYATADR